MQKPPVETRPNYANAHPVINEILYSIKKEEQNKYDEALEVIVNSGLKSVNIEGSKEDQLKALKSSALIQLRVFKRLSKIKKGYSTTKLFDRFPQELQEEFDEKELFEHNLPLI